MVGIIGQINLNYKEIYLEKSPLGGSTEGMYNIETF